MRQTWFTSINLTCWPLDVLMNKSLSQCSIHGSCLNFWVVPPVCPVHGAETWMQISNENLNVFVNRNMITLILYPLCGSTTMAYGSSIMPEMRVLQCCPDIWATSMTSRPESVQYRFPATQSTAIPRGIFSSLIWVTRERFLRLPCERVKLCLSIVQWSLEIGVTWLGNFSRYKQLFSWWSFFFFQENYKKGLLYGSSDINSNCFTPSSSVTGSKRCFKKEVIRCLMPLQVECNCQTKHKINKITTI